VSSRLKGASRNTSKNTRVSLILYLLTSLSAVPLSAQPTRKENLINCRDIKGISQPVLRNLSPHVLCRLETADVICLPGLTLMVDATETEDLCSNNEKRVVTVPSCKAKSHRRYRQRVIKRGGYLIERAKGDARVETIDIPFTHVGRVELLAQTKPIKLKGPDACVYLRQTKTVFVDPSFPPKAAQQPKLKTP